MFRRCACQLLIAGSRTLFVPVWQVPSLSVRNIRTQRFDSRLFQALRRDDDDDDDDKEADEDEDDDDDEDSEDDDDDSEDDESDDEDEDESENDEDEVESENEWSSSESDSGSDEKMSAGGNEDDELLNVRKEDMFVKGDDSWEALYLSPFYDKKLKKQERHNLLRLRVQEVKSRRKLMRLMSRKQDSRKKPRSEHKRTIEILKQRIQKIHDVREKIAQEKLSASNVGGSDSISKSKQNVSALDSELDEEEQETVKLQERLQKVESGEMKVSKKERETLIASCKNAAPLYYDGAGRPVYVTFNHEELMQQQEESRTNEENDRSRSKSNKSRNSKSSKSSSASFFDPSLSSNNNSKKKELGKLTGGVSITEPMQILESDLKETFVRSRGAGGQHVNKVNSCVDLVHVPTGTRVKCMQSRHQAVNRKLARKIMEERLAELFESKETTAMKKMTKVRRQKSRRLRRLTQPPPGLKSFLAAEKRNNASMDV